MVLTVNPLSSTNTSRGVDLNILADYQGTLHRDGYAIEQRVRDKTPDERRLARQNDAGPVMDKIKVWLEKQALNVTPKSKLGEAIRYMQNQWT